MVQKAMWDLGRESLYCYSVGLLVVEHVLMPPWSHNLWAKHKRCLMPSWSNDNEQSKEISLNNFRVESTSSGNVTNMKNLQSDDRMFVSWTNALFVNNKMNTSNTCLWSESSQVQHSLLPCVFARVWHKLLTHRLQKLTQPYQKF